MTTTTQIADDDRHAMEAIRDGADVGSYVIAGLLRKLEQTHPEWLTICEVMGDYGVHEKHPYFGAILTDEGRRVLDA